MGATPEPTGHPCPHFGWHPVSEEADAAWGTPAMQVMPVMTLIEAENVQAAQTQKAAEEREAMRVQLQEAREAEMAAQHAQEMNALRAELDAIRHLRHRLRAPVLWWLTDWRRLSLADTGPARSTGFKRRSWRGCSSRRRPRRMPARRNDTKLRWRGGQ